MKIVHARLTGVEVWGLDWMVQVLRQPAVAHMKGKVHGAGLVQLSHWEKWEILLTRGL